MSALPPSVVVQAQLDAHNAKDRDRLLATYAADADADADAEQFTLHGELLAKGHDELRARYAARFVEPDLHARLLSRTVVGTVVVDVKGITRNFPEGLGSVEMLCINEVADGLIHKASFVLGAKTLNWPTSPKA